MKTNRLRHPLCVCAATVLFTVLVDLSFSREFAGGITFAQLAQNGAAPTPIKLLKIEPVKGYAGNPFTISGEGFPAGKKVEFFWNTVDAYYVTKVLADNVEYHERSYQEKRVLLSSATVDGQGLSHSAQRDDRANRGSGRDADHGHGKWHGLARLRTVHGPALRQQIHR
jgi:hypothetical protein